MDTKAIEYVRAIIREGNVSKAAESLFISQHTRCFVPSPVQNFVNCPRICFRAAIRHQARSLQLKLHA
jgi:hypothetical protein